MGTKTNHKYTTELSYYGADHTNPRWFPSDELRTEIRRRVEHFEGGPRAIEKALNIPHRGTAVQHIIAGNGGSKYLHEVCDLLGVMDVHFPEAETPVLKPGVAHGSGPIVRRQEPTPSGRFRLTAAQQAFLKISEVQAEKQRLEHEEQQALVTLRELGLRV